MSREGTRREDAPRWDDGLSRELGGLPMLGPPPTSERRVSAAARAAFVHAFDDHAAPWCARALFRAGRATFPVFLASVVGVYLSWAFATAIALNQ